MKQYIFVLGNAYNLCKFELLSYLKTKEIKFTTVFENDPVIILDISPNLDNAVLINTLGGLIKIASVIDIAKDITPESLSNKISYSKETSLTVGVSSYFDKNLDIKYLLKNLKIILKPNVRTFRFVLPQDGTILSSIVVHKQKVDEYLIIKDEVENKFFVGKTLAVQDADSWSKRDYGRPYVSPKSGMLPPKVARMMVNIADSSIENKESGKKILLDSFCGMGTVLAEAMVVGWNVIGSDVSKEVVKSAQANLDWLKTKYPGISGNFKLNIADATHIDILRTKELVDAIVTEPYMGIAYEYTNNILTQKGKNVTKELIQNNIKGLEKLYIGALRQWHKILKKRGVVVMIFPEINFENTRFSVKKAIDSCENLGYTLSYGPFEYARSQAVVTRQIYVFIKK